MVVGQERVSWGSWKKVLSIGHFYPYRNLVEGLYTF